MKKSPKRYIKIVVALCVVMLLAVSCPDPLPVGQEEILETELLKEFKGKETVGLYENGKELIVYDPSTFQKAVALDGSMFRIQRDNQSSFLQIDFLPNSTLPIKFQIIYSINGEQQAMSILMRQVKSNGKYQWWWNDVFSIGIIISSIE